LLIAVKVQAAELLVLASGLPADKLTTEEVNTLSAKQKEIYNARLRIGDIICVKPDGWQWGTSECLPTFIVIKLPGVAVETVKHLERPLTQIAVNIDGRTIKKNIKNKNFQIPENWIKNYVDLSQSVVTIKATPQQNTFMNNILEKTQ
jgi:hypothetical protein